ATPFDGEAGRLVAEVSADMNDDLNTPSAVARLFEAVTRAHRLADDGDAEAAASLAHAVAVLFGAMGLTLRADTGDVDAESAALVVARDEARARRDFAAADRLRDDLVSRGWVVEDSPEGTTIRR
ncbi:MAG TPA: DALR domain-containing protein, partial [Acidimicrobiales bacterium]|nr:DALR domain-containing protein [Acidimicrobiales bacterium]